MAPAPMKHRANVPINSATHSLQAMRIEDTSMDFARWDSRERPRGVRAGTPYPSRARMSMLPGPEGHCVGQTISCDDGNSCTDDTCTSTAGCVHTNNSAPCNDGNACTTGDACAGGQCRGGAALNCEDGIACTVDTCDATGLRAFCRLSVPSTQPPFS